MDFPVRGVAWLGCCLMAAGCGNADADPDGVASLPQVWSVPATPLLTLGDESSPEHTFERVAGVYADRAGRILVLDGGASEARIFDAGGAFLGGWGGKGDGPGEYRAAALLGVTEGDTLVVLDHQDQVVEFRSMDGEVGRSFRFLDPEEPTPKQALGVTSRGLVIYQPVSLFTGALEEGDVLSDTARLAVMDPVQGTRTPLGTAAVPQWVWTQDEQVPMPFSPSFSFSVRNDSVFTLDGDASHVKVLSPSGGATKWTTPRKPSPVTREDRRAYADAVRARGLSGFLTELWLSALEHPEVPDSRPVYDRVLATDDGEVWARQSGGQAGLWDVYSAEGAVRGTVTLPHGAVPRQVTRDRVVAVVRDSMGVQRVEVFAKEAVRDTARIVSAIGELRAELDSLAELQAIYFADAYQFTAQPERLHRRLPVKFPEVVVSVTSAGPEGWAARATHPALLPGEGCSVVQGRPPVLPDPMWTGGDGEVVCLVGGRAWRDEDPGAGTGDA